MKRRTDIRDITIIGMLCALALIFSYVEVLIPFGNLGIPGLKLGLANITTLALMYYMNGKVAFSVSIVRVLIASLLFGMTMLPYSLAGAILSFAVMYLLKKTEKFSIVGVSLAGGIAHNIGQVIVAAIVVENFRMVFYLPVLLITGSITGVLIGICTKAFLDHLPKAYR